MQSLRKAASIITQLNVHQSACGFTSDKWKDRDEASERVYISQAESNYYITQRRP